MEQSSTNAALALAPEQLRRAVEPGTLDMAAIATQTPIEGIIGQARAVAALRFGLSIHDGGFNIYAAGPPGIGKMTAVRAFIEELAHDKPTPPDWCYVYNFDDPYQPKVCQLPAGRGRKLQQDARSLVEHIRREVPRAFEGEEYGARHEAIVKELNRQREELLEGLGDRAKQGGFVLQVSPMGVMLIPLLKERPISEQEFQALPDALREDLLRRRDGLQEELNAVMKQGRAMERTAQEQLQALDRQVALYVVGGLIDDLVEQYQDLPEIAAFFGAMQNDILENIETFKSKQSTQANAAIEGMAVPASWLRDLPFRKYQVNVLVDNGGKAGAPVVVDFNPSYGNLFGRIEKEAQFGTLTTDLTLIKSGSLHLANGGYLVLPVEDLLRNPFSWDALKRTLRAQEIEIEEIGERLGFIASKSLRPQPVPIDLKVVLVGPPALYYLLQSLDESFPELFKVKVDFDTTMPRGDETIRDVARFALTFCEREKLRPPDAAALAKLLEHASRLAEDQGKLSANFRMLADVVREANFWAAQAGAAGIGAEHIRRAIDEKIYRSSLIQQHVQELIADGTLRIDTTGARVGQVNGLAVLSLGDYEFGRPSRITASAGPGRAGIVDIEREVELGGPLHSKGVLILSGYLTRAYAQDRPLQLSARLVFEQSYEGVEGDSASSAELYALLSALADLPIRQGIAVTGSVDQQGTIQAIGGVNQKVEGFFDTCKARGLTGEQGVLIPRSNARHLMLREDVIEAVRAGTFHVWAVATADEGIELLTGVPAGSRDEQGNYAAGSVNERIERRLRDFDERLRERDLAKDNGRVVKAH